MARQQQNDAITALLESDRFLKLEPAIQQQVLTAIKTEHAKSGGLLGRLLGNKPANLAIHAIFVLCLALLVLILFDNLHAYKTGSAINMELINIIIPVITLAIGYIIGNGTKSAG